MRKKPLLRHDIFSVRFLSLMRFFSTCGLMDLKTFKDWLTLENGFILHKPVFHKVSCRLSSCCQVYARRKQKLHILWNCLLCHCCGSPPTKIQSILYLYLTNIFALSEQWILDYSLSMLHMA